MIESVRVSLAAREQLITLKRRTGLQQWNELSRWALCRSLAETSIPADIPIVVEDGVEMSWRTFTGSQGDLYLTLIQDRCERDGLPVDEATIAHQLRLHLHRGVGYLVGDPRVTDIRGLLSLAEN